MIYLKINDTLYPASFRQRVQDGDWGNRGSMAITVTMDYQEAAGLFVNGLRWFHVVQHPAYADADGNLVTPDPVVTDYSEFEMAGPITDNRDGTVTVKMGKALSGECNAALTGSAATLTVREVTELRSQMETVYQLAVVNMTADEVIQNRVMCKAWAAGNHIAGEVYSVDGQPWYCYADYDNAVYDVFPGSTAWPTFNKPYHGTTPETALPFVEPTHSQDIYKAGEYMIWTDGTMKMCIRDSSFGPDYDPDAWEDADV